MIAENYLEKVYAGFLGMNIGIRIGAPVEATVWSYERIEKTYGEITGYVKDYINFAADDDVNGPFYFLRALYDDAKARALQPQDVARAWLNYAREGTGMFWWGGYGRSTEHTAYLNLKSGIPAPRSGSIAQNGKILAEQIGGQIFIDTWGLVNPGNPERAAQMGATAASVSHDGEGLEGARFMCAAIALAFEMDNIDALVDRALTYIRPDSTYHAVARAVIEFYHAHPDNWRDCRKMLGEQWGYDRYGGVCHIIPNAGVCFLALMYGRGDFNRTVEIATMAGWDTDCNAGNVGTIVGVMNGLDGLAARYRDPINDMIVLSGISGDLNILDVPTYAKELALLGYRLSGETPPEGLKAGYREGEIYLDFALPGSTHGMRVSDAFFSRITHASGKGREGKNAIAVQIDRANRFEGSRVFYKPFYRRKDFSDERYSPVFSPKVYSGQTLSMSLYLDQWEGMDTILVKPYARLAMSEEILDGGFVKLQNHEWTQIDFVLPDSKGEPIDEIGFIYEGNSKTRTLGMLYMDELSVRGTAEYDIDLTKSAVDFGMVVPFAQNHGAWSMEEGTLHAITCEPAIALTGRYFAKNTTIKAPLCPENGDGHMLCVRAQGIARGYFAGFTSPGRIGIWKNDFELTPLAEADFDWAFGTWYDVEVSAAGSALTLCIDGKEVLCATDDAFAYGMVGFAKPSIGRTRFGNVHVCDK